GRGGERLSDPGGRRGALPPERPRDERRRGARPYGGGRDLQWFGAGGLGAARVRGSLRDPEPGGGGQPRHSVGGDGRWDAGGALRAAPAVQSALLRPQRGDARDGGAARRKPPAGTPPRGHQVPDLRAGRLRRRPGAGVAVRRAPRGSEMEPDAS